MTLLAASATLELPPCSGHQGKKGDSWVQDPLAFSGKRVPRGARQFWTSFWKVQHFRVPQSPGLASGLQPHALNKGVAPMAFATWFWSEWQILSSSSLELLCWLKSRIILPPKLQENKSACVLATEFCHYFAYYSQMIVGNLYLQVIKILLNGYSLRKLNQKCIICCYSCYFLAFKSLVKHSHRLW